MSELAVAMEMMSKMSTAILKYPSGKYGLVGSVPIELTEERISGYSKVNVSKVWNTEQEAIEALLAIGITRFQLPDCSWHKET